MKRVFAYFIMMLAFVVFVKANPVLNPISNQQVIEGKDLVITITNTIPDNGTTNYTKSGSLPGGSLTKINDTLATFSWTAPLVSSNTTYNLTITVADANSSYSSTINITVINLPAGPIMNTISNKVINEGQELKFNISCSPPDNGTTTFSLLNTTIGSITKINDTLATFSWTAPLVSSNKVFTQTVRCGDADSYSNKTIQITVRNVYNGLYISSLNLGGDNQKRSNPRSKDEGYHNVYITSTFTIQNRDPNTVNNVKVIWPADSDYNITYVSSTKTGTLIDHGIQFSTLAPNEEVNITIRIRIPKYVDAFNPDISNPNDNREYKMGQLSLLADGYSPVHSDIKVLTKNYLTIDKMYIKVGNNAEERVENGDIIDKIKPGDKITLRIKLSNNYDDDDRLDIRDITVNIKIDSTSWKEDADKDFGDLDEDTTKEKTFSFYVDEDADEDIYDVYITAFGKDRNGAMQGEQWKLKFDVEREKKDIQIKSAVLDNDVISLCNDITQTFLRVKIKNEGSRDSDEIALRVKSPELKLDAKFLEIDLSTGDSISKTIPINIPKNIKPGIYKIDIFTYFDYNDLQDNVINNFRTVSLELKECPIKQETKKEIKNNSKQENKTEEVEIIETKINPETTSENNKIPKGAAIAQPPEETKESFMNEKTEVVLLVLAYIVVIFIGLAIIIKLAKH